LDIKPPSWAMATHRKELPNSLKALVEPEQLELFGKSALDESVFTPDSLGNLCSRFLCERMAAVVNQDYHLDLEQANHLRNLLVHHCSGEPSSTSRLTEYLAGLAMTMNLLPTSPEYTFLQSDRTALAADWAVVQGDINRVWNAISTAQKIAERISHERSKQEGRRGDAHAG
jgi:hypothetical protein